MATSSDSTKLLESSNDSFEFVSDMSFDEFYHQLIGIATANYIPLEDDEILLEKGKCIIILLSKNKYYLQEQIVYPGAYYSYAVFFFFFQQLAFGSFKLMKNL